MGFEPSSAHRTYMNHEALNRNIYKAYMYDYGAFVLESLDDFGPRRAIGTRPYENIGGSAGI